ncbi:hypothetical protein COS93_00980 [bacterium (Candidatus Gribaldobacteria) CG07_land_8_20_14_0_80_33_18]|uniref:Elongation factor P n=1 Tax=bacterium (Candidatus Gribaldobacteria) CG07_land_8_20_14_0_80_33_18 TaxID=2014272 RepID=A0A2M6Z3Q0_9BACT|nr:MAG: hypothetical protein COS93_00980 [bacterium (Candidatus Gribaldobacteria) CG07_land_8_20_14_0_80_33_18]
MLTYFELRKGVKFILDEEPCEVLDFEQIKMAQRRSVARVKMRNLITGQVLEKTFQQSDKFEEVEIDKIDLKFLYFNKGNYYFCKLENPSERFSFTEVQIGESAKFLKTGQVVQGLVFNNKIININLPIKVHLKVIEAPPGIKGDRAQGGTKVVKLETNTLVNVPLFIKEGDIVEINTETNEYVRRPPAGGGKFVSGAN